VDETSSGSCPMADLSIINFELPSPAIIKLVSQLVGQVKSSNLFLSHLLPTFS